MQHQDVIIIGVGAAGMMAAIKASEMGKKVLLLEKMDQAGRKLRITGKGRCNLTNTAPIKETITHIGSDGRFMRNSFSRFFNNELMQFFENHNVPLVEERGNRVFPKSGKSLDIFLALINTIEKNPDIQIRKNTAVSHLIINEGEVLGVETSDGTRFYSSKVIIATGGCSYPSTGSTGDGYSLSKEANHTIIEPVPALVALSLQEPVPEDLVNFNLRNVSLSSFHNGKKLSEFFGEMTFVEDGISGPITLSTSRVVSRLLHEGEKVEVRLDFKPALEQDVLDKRLINDLDQNGNRVLNDALRMWMPAELIPLFFSRVKIEKFKRLNQISGAERKEILRFLKNTTFTLSHTHPFEDAIITQGGVELKEVNPKTMESKLTKGLYFAGEVLDLDADTGGYNLQIAFSTGFVAGMLQ